MERLWQKLIVCNDVKDASGKFVDPCDFEDLIELAGVVMNNLIVVAIVAATIAFVWIGFTLLTSQGNPSALQKAKDIGWKVVWGLVFVLAGWLIVYTISSVLLSTDGDFSILKSL